MSTMASRKSPDRPVARGLFAAKKRIPSDEDIRRSEVPRSSRDEDRRGKNRRSESPEEDDPPPKAEESRISKFRKNTKFSRNAPSQLKKKLINVWRRDPAGKKHQGGQSPDEDSHNGSEDNEKAEEVKRSSRRQQQRRRQLASDEETEDQSSGDEDTSKRDLQQTAATTPARRKLRSPGSRRSESDHDEVEIIDEEKEKKRKTRSRHSSQTSRGSGGERSGRTSSAESDIDAPSVKEVTKTSTRSILADESIRVGKAGIGETNLWSLANFELPAQRTEEAIDQWKSLIYYPSTAPISISEKLPEDTALRFVEDEGIYVGSPIQLSERNQRRLEHRMLMKKAYEWFGPDGRITSFPDPYRPERIQLFSDENNINELIRCVQFKSAQLDPFQEFQIDPKMTYEIIVDVGSVNFKHHPLFSKEHVLASRLEASYDEYSRRKEAKLTERAENKLKALREALHHCKEVKEKLRHDGSGDKENAKANIEHLEDRVQIYRQEMRRARMERKQSWRDDKACIANVLDAWKALKGLRSHQDFVSTNLKLNILATNDKYEVAKETWKAEIEQELEDLREEYEDEYRVRLNEYKQDLKEWTESRRKRKQKRKSKPKKGRKGQEDDTDDKRDGGSGEEESEVASDKSDSSGPSLSSKPIPPVRFDEEVTKNEIISLFHELKRLPGEPKITLELTKSLPVTPRKQLPPQSNDEIQRRKAVEKTKLELKLMFNKKEVFKSSLLDLTPDFSVFFGLTIPVSVREWPESLKAVVIQCYKSSRSLMSEIDLPLPSRNTSIERCHIQKIEFQCTEVVKTNHAGVGCGVPFSTPNEENDGLFTCGYVSARLGWTTDQNGHIICPPGYDKTKSKEDLKSLDLTARELLERGDIQKWSENAQLDPNDPKNAKWIHDLAKKFIRARRESLQMGGDGTEDDEGRISRGSSGVNDDGDFCSLEHLDRSPRFRVLQLRDDLVREFKHYRMIPAYDKDIPRSIFDTYEKRLKEDSKKKSGDSGSKLRKRMIEDDMDYEWNRLEKIREIRTKVLRLFESSQKQITFDDIILEEQIPDIGTLGLNLMTLFQPRRPLRPTRRERKRVQGSSLADTKLTLIVNIVRAFNLPLRKDTDVGLLTTESVTGIPLSKKRAGSVVSSYSTVRPFVEIWFQRNVCRTTTALGANPTWNQELQLNLVVPDDDYSQENLSKMDDLIYMLVYDEVAIDLLEDDRRRETDIHQRLEKRWLGAITVPFSTLFVNGRIEGTFRLNMPSILLGYEAQGVSSNFLNPLAPRGASTSNLRDKFNIQSSTSAQKSTFITLFATLQPAVQRTVMSKEECATGETADMLAHVTTWKQTILKKFPDRAIRPFVMNIEGETILCIRYLKPIPPPDSLTNSDSDILRNMEDLAHFVSAFPAVRDSTLGIMDYSLWFTSDVFVATPGGGTEDHAVLLACFFMHLEVPCWIVQGNAIPDGPSAYVVTSLKGLSSDLKVPKHVKNNILIWNPCSGEYYLANDNFCPLQKVWSVISNTNMWANISDHERPHQLDWDLSKATNWRPLFSKPVEDSKVSSVQITDIVFKAADQNQANSLAQRMERHLKDAFMRWRKTSKTKWNRYCTAILRRLLPRLEEIKSGKGRSSAKGSEDRVAESSQSYISDTGSNLNDDHLVELRDIMTSYQMTGFPLQQAYVNMESVAESVYATGVHTIDTPEVEFAVAVYARSFPAGVYSVWIYIAALHRRK